MKSQQGFVSEKAGRQVVTHKTDLRKLKHTLSIGKPEKQPHLYLITEPPKGTGTDGIQSSSGRGSRGRAEKRTDSKLIYKVDLYISPISSTPKHYFSSALKEDWIF